LDNVELEQALRLPTVSTRPLSAGEPPEFKANDPTMSSPWFF